MKKSLWAEGTLLPEFPSLKDKIKTDVLIIGGGMCGILCAHFLEKAGVDYVLVEGKRIGQGITKNTTAKITSQHKLIYHSLTEKAGWETAYLYMEANECAVAKFKELAERIPCDFEEKSAFTYSLTDRRKIEEEVEAVKGLGFSACFEESIPIPLEIEGAVKFENQAQFHPLKFLAGLAKNKKIYENTFINDISEHTAKSKGGEIQAEKVIVATHFPFLNKYGAYFLKLYQSRSYVLALENAGEINGMYIDEADTGLSFRNYKNFLLIGGGGHRTGKTGGGFQKVRQKAAELYPGSREAYAWAAQDCMSLDGLPYIGKYSRWKQDFYVASGFQKWGMTGAMVSAMVLSDMVQEKKNPWSGIFSPQRSIWTPQLFINGWEAAENLLTFSEKRCPHLGCALKWNSAEHTWDCPCHGSRFEEDGTLIDNPATGDIKL